jgi:capsular polysaccharide transport system permease protein
MQLGDTQKSRVPRYCIQVTWSVWTALFFREFLTRVVADGLPWFWMLFEPVALIGVMVAIRTVVLGRDHHIGGAEFVPWSLVVLVGVFLVRENMMRSIGAVESGRQLYAYRQVQPKDPVIVRCYLEGVLKETLIY